MFCVHNWCPKLISKISRSLKSRMKCLVSLLCNYWFCFVFLFAFLFWYSISFCYHYFYFYHNIGNNLNFFHNCVSTSQEIATSSSMLCTYFVKSAYSEWCEHNWTLNVLIFKTGESDFCPKNIPLFFPNSWYCVPELLQWRIDFFMCLSYGRLPLSTMRTAAKVMIIMITTIHVSYSVSVTVSKICHTKSLL